MSDQAPTGRWRQVADHTYALDVPGGQLYRTVGMDGTATMVFAPITPPPPALSAWLELYIDNTAYLHRCVGRAYHNETDEPWIRFWISSVLRTARLAGLKW